MPLSSSTKNIHLLITTFILILTLAGSFAWFMNPPVVTKGDSESAFITENPSLHVGKHVVLHLEDMTLTLYDGTTTISVYPLVSQGKPGSYYETLGGSYVNDYKVPLHFSSIGHVYMPYSVHIFGNYFIHGIPYYPNGTRVATTYSGGCIRLSNEHAKIVYDFIEKGTPIVITRSNASSFLPTDLSSSTLFSASMTNLMVASISLEVLTQDNRILGVEGEVTTRRKILPKLILNGNPLVAKVYAESVGEENFISLMNQKAKALGLTNTHFTDVTSPVMTTYEEYDRFMKYIATYKSYLNKIQDVDDRP